MSDLIVSARQYVRLSSVHLRVNSLCKDPRFVASVVLIQWHWYAVREGNLMTKWRGGVFCIIIHLCGVSWIVPLSLFTYHRSGGQAGGLEAVGGQQSHFIISCKYTLGWMQLVNIGSGYGLVSSGSTPLPEPIVTQFYGVLLRSH